MNYNDRFDERIALRRRLSEQFSEQDIKTLCFDFGIDPSDLGDGISSMSRELVQKFVRSGDLSSLRVAVDRFIQERDYQLNPGKRRKDHERLYASAINNLESGDRDTAIRQLVTLASWDAGYRDLTSELHFAVTGVKIKELQAFRKAFHAAGESVGEARLELVKLKKLYSDLEDSNSMLHRTLREKDTSFLALEERSNYYQSRTQKLEDRLKQTNDDLGKLLRSHSALQRRHSTLERQKSDLQKELYFSPTNPVNHIRFLYWLLLEPQRLDSWKISLGADVAKPLAAWVISALFWIPLIFMSFAFTLELPQTTYTLPPAVYVPIVFLLASAFLITSWLTNDASLNRIISRRSDKWGTFARNIVSWLQKHRNISFALLFLLGSTLGVTIGAAVDFITRVAIFTSMILSMIVATFVANRVAYVAVSTMTVGYVVGVLARFLTKNELFFASIIISALMLTSIRIIKKIIRIDGAISTYLSEYYKSYPDSSLIKALPLILIGAYITIILFALWFGWP